MGRSRNARSPDRPIRFFVYLAFRDLVALQPLTQVPDSLLKQAAVLVGEAALSSGTGRGRAAACARAGAATAGRRAVVGRAIGRHGGTAGLGARREWGGGEVEIHLLVCVY